MRGPWAEVYVAREQHTDATTQHTEQECPAAQQARAEQLGDQEPYRGQQGGCRRIGLDIARGLAGDRITPPLQPNLAGQRLMTKAEADAKGAEAAAVVIGDQNIAEGDKNVQSRSF